MAAENGKEEGHKQQQLQGLPPSLKGNLSCGDIIHLACCMLNCHLSYLGHLIANLTQLYIEFEKWMIFSSPPRPFGPNICCTNDHIYEF